MIYYPHLKPKAFWPYTSGVMEVGLLMKTNYSNGDVFDRWKDDLIKLFNSHGIKCQTDNKIVFEFWDATLDRPLFVGFYDLRMSIGHYMRSDHFEGIYPPISDEERARMSR